MPKFRRKVIDGAVVDAEQYTGPESVPTNEPLPVVQAGVSFFKIDNTDERYPFVGNKGKTRLHPGDWILTNTDGDIWGLAAHLFADYYEPIPTGG